MVTEIWSKIDGFDTYEISSLGRVKSLSKKILYGDKIRVSKDKILKPSISREFYYVFLSVDGKVYKRQIHSLVAIHFMNHNPTPRTHRIGQYDNNKLNCRLENLYIYKRKDD